MPELPEVETVRRGLQPHLEGERILRAEARRPDLRWPLPPDLVQVLTGARVTGLRRRSKYILADLEDRGSLLLHLGMSGRMLIEDEAQGAFHRDPAILPRHDHVVFWTERGTRITFNDARRFGMVDLIPEGAEHPLLAHLGPEPLSDAFNADYLQQKCAKKKTAIKPWLMDNKLVVGVGNIYASESLFSAGIHPDRLASSLSRDECEQLVKVIKLVLLRSIEQGGTTLKDFLQSDGKPGYFAQELQVYGRKGEPCRICGTPVVGTKHAQRATFYCRQCQK